VKKRTGLTACDTTKPTFFRSPPELRAKLEARARLERRTLSNLIVSVLYEGLGAREEAETRLLKARGF
jgi:hypothetical protein